MSTENEKNHTEMYDDPGYATGEKLRPCRCGRAPGKLTAGATKDNPCEAIGCTSCGIYVYAKTTTEARKLWNAAMRPDVPSVVQQPGEWVYPPFDWPENRPRMNEVIEMDIGEKQLSVDRYSGWIISNHVRRWRYVAVATHPANPAVAEAVREIREWLWKYYNHCVTGASDELKAIADKLEAAGQPVNVEAEIEALAAKSVAQPVEGAATPSPSLTEAVDAIIESLAKYKHEDRIFSYPINVRETMLRHLAGFSRVEPQRPGELCYLIERAGPLYLAARKLAGYEFHWQDDVRKAICFTLRDQADLVMMAIRQLRDDLFPVALPMPQIVEHVFCSDEPQRPGGDTGWIERFIHECHIGPIEATQIRQNLQKYLPPSVPLDDRERCAKAVDKLASSEQSSWAKSALREAAAEIRLLPPAQEGLRSKPGFVSNFRDDRDPFYVAFNFVSGGQSDHIPCTVAWLDPSPAAEPPSKAKEYGRILSAYHQGGLTHDEAVARLAEIGGR